MTYKRILVKLSGEVLAGHDGGGIDGQAVTRLCQEIVDISRQGIQVAVVVGGGNFWRYRDNMGLSIPRSASDAIGMMATIMNARLLAEVLNTMGVIARAMAPHADFYFSEPYVPSRGKQLLDRGELVICGGGIGNPYFTTDSTAALRALELECDVLMKATKVDGVYDSDPVANPDAKFYSRISYEEVLKRELAVMDLTAIVLSKENQLPVHVFNGEVPGNLLKAVTQGNIGTLIHA